MIQRYTPPGIMVDAPNSAFVSLAEHARLLAESINAEVVLRVAARLG